MSEAFVKIDQHGLRQLPEVTEFVTLIRRRQAGPAKKTDPEAASRSGKENRSGGGKPVRQKKTDSEAASRSGRSKQILRQQTDSGRREED